MLQRCLQKGNAQVLLSLGVTARSLTEAATSGEGLATHVITLDLSKRVLNALQRADLHTVGDICNCSQDELLRIPNLQRRGINEITELLKSMGFNLRQS
jgi:DNA-directed RNA polymerase alpha subunit